MAIDPRLLGYLSPPPQDPNALPPDYAPMMDQAPPLVSGVPPGGAPPDLSAAPPGMAPGMPPGMLNSVDTPMMPMGPAEPPFAPGPYGPDPQVDYYKQMVKEDKAPLIQQVQNRRRVIEEQWLFALDCWKAKHRRQGFRGEWFNHYLPAGRRSLERFVTRCRKMLFPQSEFFEVYPIQDQLHAFGAVAEMWRAYLLWRIDEIRGRGVVEQLIRCRQLYQRAISKTTLVKDDDGLLWPSFRAVDPFTHYVFPETATSIEAASFVFEHSMMPVDEYQMYVSMGMAEPVDLTRLTKPEWPWHYQMRLSASGLTTPSDAPMIGSGGQTADFVSMTELWFRDQGHWVMCWLVWNVQDGPQVVRVNLRFPINPYRMSLARVLPGEQYTNSMMSDLEPLNVVLNDQCNMTLEGQATSYFSPVVVDPDQVARQDSLVYKPRAKWLGNPEGFKVLENSTSRASQAAGYAGQAATLGMIDSFSGGNSTTGGDPTRGLPRAGFAASQLINLSMADIQDVAEALEYDILTPTLKDMARLTTDLVPPQQLLMIPGLDGLVQAIQNVDYLRQGQYAFRWVGSLAGQDQQQKAQRMIALLGTTAKIYPAMVQQGFDLDFVTLYKVLWRDAVGERGADSIVIRKPPPPPMPPGMPPGGPQGPPGQPPMPGAGGAVAPAPAGPQQAVQQDSRAMAQQNPAQQMSGVSGAV